MTSGIYQGIHHFFIPPKEVQQKDDFKRISSPWYQWVDGRLQTFAYVIYQLILRVILFVALLPYLSVLFLAAFFDGVMTWKLKRTNFDYTSPVFHRFGWNLFTHLMLGLVMLFWLPLPLHPLLIFIVMIIVCVVFGFSVGHVQKRI